MRELDFINVQTPAPDAAVTAYVDLYAQDPPEEAVKAIRAATSLGTKKVSRALAVVAAETGVAGGSMSMQRQMLRRGTTSQTNVPPCSVVCG
jgi:hypothetical protein